MVSSKVGVKVKQYVGAYRVLECSASILYTFCRYIALSLSLSLSPLTQLPLTGY